MDCCRRTGCNTTQPTLRRTPRGTRPGREGRRRHAGAPAHAVKLRIACSGGWGSVRAGLPSVRLRGPPAHRAGVLGRGGELLKVRLERIPEEPFGVVRRSAEGEQGMRARDRTIRLDVDRDVAFVAAQGPHGELSNAERLPRPGQSPVAGAGSWCGGSRGKRASRSAFVLILPRAVVQVIGRWCRSGQDSCRGPDRFHVVPQRAPSVALSGSSPRARFARACVSIVSHPRLRRVVQSRSSRIGGRCAGAQGTMDVVARLVHRV